MKSKSSVKGGRRGNGYGLFVCLLLCGCGAATPVASSPNAKLPEQTRAVPEPRSWPSLASAPKGESGDGAHDVVVIVAPEEYLFLEPIEGSEANARDWVEFFKRTRGVPPARIYRAFGKATAAETIESKVEVALGHTNSEGTLWFVFIGHGTTIPDEAGRSRGYLLGADTQQTLASVRTRGIATQELLRKLNGGKQGKTVAILDACFSGLDTNGKQLIEGGQLGMTEQAIKVRGERTTVLTATSATQFAGQLPGLARPAYSYLLLGALHGWARPEGSSEGVTAAMAHSWASDVLEHLPSRRQEPQLRGDRGIVLSRPSAVIVPDVVALMNPGSASARVESSGRVQQRAGAEASCSAGQVRNEDTGGHCCWPGQGWSGTACVGTPECPVGQEVDTAGTGCQVPGCEDGKVRMRDGVHCCWSGQAWLSSKQMCVGKPESCPGDLVRDEEACGCPSGTTQVGLECKEAATEMVEVPAGKFLMGSSSGQDDEKPVHEVYVSGFFIDKYEVTVDEYKRCVEAGGCSTPKYEHNDAKSTSEYEEHHNYGASGRGKHPINSVDWHQAKAYCTWVGKRLPTEAEWEKAARGTDGRKYPWGDGAVGGVRYGNFADETAKRVFGDSKIVEGYEDGYAGTAPVGSYPSGVSPYGVHDMAGNVWEWTADWYASDDYGSSPTRDPKGPTQGSDRVIRGGSWADPGAYLRADDHFFLAPGDAYGFLGFRCVRSLF